MSNWFTNLFKNINENSKKEKKTPEKTKTPAKPKMTAQTKAQPKAQTVKGKTPKPVLNAKKKPEKKTQRTTQTDSEEKADKTPKPRRTNSMESVFNTNKTPADYFGSRLSPLNTPPLGSYIYDVGAYLLHCPEHNKIAVGVEEKYQYVWLPFVSLPLTRTWKEGALDGANIVLSGGDANLYLTITEGSVMADVQCMQLFRLQLPQTQRFNVRIICYIKLTSNPKFKCCTDNKRLRWIPLKDINKVENLWGPELKTFAAVISKKIVQTVEEYSLDEAFMYVPRDPPRNLEEEMLKSTNFTEKDVERLYGDFIEHCFPAFYMTPTSFNDYMSKYGFEKMDRKLELLFKAFNYKKGGYLSFHEFLLGLTSIDPNAFNGQSRIKFVFKYFDVDGDGYLNDKEFTSLMREIYPNDSDSQLKIRVKEHTKTIGVKKNGIFFDDFFKAVGAHKLRGTSGLCRSNLPIIQRISRSMATRTLRKTHTGKSTLGSILENVKYQGICKSCKDNKYTYATHSVKIGADGRCCDPKPLPEWSQLEKQESSEKLEIQKTESKEQIETLKSSPSSTAITGLTHEKYFTKVVWNPKSVANTVIELIRAFNLKKGSYKDNRGVMDGKEERGPFVKLIKQLCDEVQKVVAQEDRCAKVNSPAFIIGDIHGNIEDLFTMEKVLWKSFPIVSANYVFLGDYVDRGKWGLECALYLMCVKLLTPNKIVMLRGNHEVRELQKNYTYKKECYNKYGDTLGEEVFEVTNRVFDRLPVCAVIDEAIFCAHGGIPCSTRQIEKINEVKNDLKDPERESAIAWEILWSDPIGPQQFAEAADLLKVRLDSARGFLTNAKRGTAFLFGEEAANNFLQANGLTHIVRAHEVPAPGYTFHFGNKCTTIFSCSHYCGNNNEAAVVYVDNEKLRIVRLDTVNNAPASDAH